jgi:hypothetical protein
MLTPSVSKDEYEQMKSLFEARHFYYVPMNTFVEVDDQESLTHYELKHATEYFDVAWGFGGADNFCERTSFLGLWRKDPSRKCIHRLDFKPSEDPLTYYIPIQFAFTRVTQEMMSTAPAGTGSGWSEEVHQARLLELFITLVKAAADDKPELEEYLLNYFAHVLQKPLEQPGVSIIFTGQKGVGKDTLLDFFRLFVVGPKLSHNYTETRQFFDKHDTDRKDKFFIKVEDSDSALCKQHAKDLRARITAREGTVNPKGKASITFPNYVRYAFTANQAIPVGINDDQDKERRFVIFSVSSALKGNEAFFNEVYNEESGLFTAMGGKVVADFLMAKNLADWNVRRQPKNDYQEALYEVERTPEQRFLEDGWTSGMEYKSQDLFSLYQRFCSDNGFPNWTETAIAFGQKLAYFVMHKRIIKRVGGKKQVFYLKPKKIFAAGAGGGAGGTGGGYDGEDEDEGHEEDTDVAMQGAYAGTGSGAGFGSGSSFSATTTAQR